MDGIPAFEIIATTAIMVAGWFLRTLWDNHKDLEKRVNDHYMDIAERYLRKDDYRVDIAEIKGMLDKIFNQLNTKVDK